LIAVFLAGASALIWGTADYCGGRASRRAPALAVTVAGQVVALPLLVLAVPVLGGELYGVDLLWGAGAGVAGLGGLVLLYRGLSTGAMAIVAPITAVTGALVPMAVGLATERTPPPLALAGAACAVLAIGLVSVGPSDRIGPGRSGTAQSGAGVVLLALASGVMFGLFFSLFAQTHETAGVWPLVAARVASVGLGLVALAVTRVSLLAVRPVSRWVVVAGVGDIAANWLYLLALADGLLGVVAPIAALYPVSTVLLALTIDKERVRAMQIAGLGLAAAALVLTAI
jgi:drug/metabolite transporter (DMT)-like permease